MIAQVLGNVIQYLWCLYCSTLLPVQ